MMDNENIAQKCRRYYRQLVEMREQIRQGLDLHTSETLKRSSKEDSGDLSGYSQHMADAGTDTFDRDFALSLVSSEQELLYEIEEALKRMRKGTYGICEITAKPISPERLAAVPFTRYSLEGQKELEKQRRFGTQRSTAVGVFGEATTEDAAALAEDDAEADHVRALACPSFLSARARAAGAAYVRFWFTFRRALRRRPDEQSLGRARISKPGQLFHRRRFPSLTDFFTSSTSPTPARPGACSQHSRVAGAGWAWWRSPPFIFFRRQLELRTPAAAIHLRPHLRRHPRQPD